MKAVCLLAFSIIWFWTANDCQKFRQLKHRRCRAEKNKYYSADKKRCQRCPKCDKGWGLRPDPKDIDTIGKNIPTTCYKCQPCALGYFSDTRDYAICRVCYNCDILGRVVPRPCDPTRNAICGDCKPRYHDVHQKRSKIPDPTKPCQQCRFAASDTPECIHPTVLASSPAPTHNLPSQKQVQDLSGHNPPSDRIISGTTNSRTTVAQTGGITLFATAIMASLVTVAVVGVTFWLKRRTSKPACSSEVVTLSRLMSPEIPDSETPDRETQDSDTPDKETPDSDTPDRETPDSDTSNNKNRDSETPDWKTLDSDTPNNEIRDSGWLQNETQQTVAHGGEPEREHVRCLGNYPCNRVDPTPAAALYAPQPSVQDSGRDLTNTGLTLEEKRLLRRVGPRWPEVARLLGLDDVDINELCRATMESEGERIHQMLLRWERRFPDQATFMNAYKALLLMGEADLAQLLLDTVATSPVL